MAEASSEAQPLVVGPFLGALSADGVRVCVALPDQPGIERLTCTLTTSSGSSEVREVLRRSERYGMFAFDFFNLSPSELYQYGFTTSEGVVEIPDLQLADMAFRPIGDCSPGDSFVLATCHNPFSERHRETWVMWERLDALISEDPSVRLLVLAGDQVYHDDLEKAYIGRLAASPHSEEVHAELRHAVHAELRHALIRNYGRFWSAPSYRRVLARVPSVAMWDDHDITDGWGGRPEQFEGDRTKLHWQQYFEAAREAFEAYQAVRNPPKLDGVPAGSFTCHLTWGDNRFYLCDFRSQKNSRLERFWARDQEEAFLASVAEEDDSIARIFVVSPVVPLRTDPELENTLNGFTKAAFAAGQWASRTDKSAFWKRILVMLASWAGRELGGLTDDLNDSLLAPCNRQGFTRLLEQLFAARARGIDVAILSGDIHTAGISELIQRSDGVRLTIPQIVSSPIAHKVMSSKIEGWTTAVKQILVSQDESRTVIGRNGGYFSDRNFAQIFPGRLRDHTRGLPVRFHFENHDDPMSFPASFFDSAS